MPFYQGRALMRARRRGPFRPGRMLLASSIVLVAAAAVTQLPWRGWLHSVAVVTRIEVRGNRYLDAERIQQRAGLHVGEELLSLDLKAARDSLARHPRIARALARHSWPRGIVLEIEERQSVLVVSHGTPWEIDSSGVLMPPLAPGALPDVPLLTGVDLSPFPAGSACRSPQVARALAWVEALSLPQLQLAGDLSEIDVREQDGTALVLTSGARVLAPSWPPGLSRLSALRVVLADLAQRKIAPGEVDLRFSDQVIVRPAVAATAGPRG